MFVKREEEFAPIKNGWNSEVDSPRSARKLLADSFRRRIEQFGGRLLPEALDNPDQIVELSPLLPDDKLIELVCGKDIVGPTVLG